MRKTIFDDYSTVFGKRQPAANIFCICGRRIVAADDSLRFNLPETAVLPTTGKKVGKRKKSGASGLKNQAEAPLWRIQLRFTGWTSTVKTFAGFCPQMHMPPQKCSLTANDGASPPPEWCTASAEMVHGGRECGAPGRHAGNYSGMPLRFRMDSPSIWMV